MFGAKVQSGVVLCRGAFSGCVSGHWAGHVRTYVRLHSYESVCLRMVVAFDLEHSMAMASSSFTLCSPAHNYEFTPSLFIRCKWSTTALTIHLRQNDCMLPSACAPTVLFAKKVWLYSRASVSYLGLRSFSLPWFAQFLSTLVCAVFL